MAITVPYEQNATISTTEISMPNDGTSLQSITDDGVYQLFLDLSALVAGDVFELKIKEKVESAGTQRVVQHITFAHAQGAEPHWFSPTYILVHGWDMTLKRLAGADRTIAWSIRKVA